MTKRILFIIHFCICSALFFESGGQTPVFKPLEIDAYKEEKHSWTRLQASYEINRQDINDTSPENLTNALQNSPGVSIWQGGSSGTQTNLSVRGLDPEYTLVMIDGVVVNNPTSPSGDFDWSVLDALLIEKIEVLPGSQGFLHGSDAISGVINIVTASPKGDNFSWKIFGGAPNLYGARISQDFNNQKNLGFTIGLSYLLEKAVSNADEYLGNTEKDKASKLNVNWKGFWEIHQRLSLDYSLQFSKQNADLDRGGGVGQDDPNYQQHQHLLNGKLALVYQPQKQHILKFQLGKNFSSRELTNLPDEQSNSALDSLYQGMRIRPEMIYEYAGNHFHLLNQVMMDYERSDQQVELGVDQINDSFLLAIASKISNPQKKLFLWEVAARYSISQDYQNSLTYKLGIGHRWRHLKLRANYATGFKAPSLYQLFDSQYGNENLFPEKSQTLEVGLDYRFSRDSSISFNLFQNTLYEQIIFREFYQNHQQNRNQGIEMYGQRRVNPWLKLQGSLTYIKFDDFSSIFRKPQTQYSLKASFERNKWRFFSQLRGKGQRNDYDYVKGQKVDLETYQIINIGVSFVLKSGLKASVSINNILDRDYREVWGYSQKGRNFLVSLEGVL